MTDYKDTLNLPQTDFPMKADLAKRELLILSAWQTGKIAEKLKAQVKNYPTFILHDGPPYANGSIHMGHVRNKILKDIVMKSKMLSGFNTPYIPGWDCHGLPIELNVEKTLEKKNQTVTPHEFRKLCRLYAASQVEIQRTAFKRLGVWGDWDKPYLTMDFHFEANVLRSLAKIIANGHLQRGHKPVHWCTQCASALAEAEVEYQDKKSLAIDVSFAVVEPLTVLKAMQLTQTAPPRIEIVIWTTTPWTLPANQAVALHPKTEYALVNVSMANNQRYLLMAAPLIDAIMTRFTASTYQIIGTCKGQELEKIRLHHPFLERQVPIILGDHVTIDAGTGAVHTAPAHGQEDYIIGNYYQLPVENPVDDQGYFITGTPFFAGKHVETVNTEILQVLQEKEALLHCQTLQHSYPHCWRHKKPLIFRATPQWFISMEQNGLRAQVLNAIKQVKWLPEWAQARITDMVLQRPDWCISRQRTWGTPLTLLVHKKTDIVHPDMVNLIEQIALLVEKEGIEAWYTLDPATLLGGQASDYRKVTDTLDVWFDSGVTHACVLSQRPQLSWPAQLYLEGSDQYRGWFQSSLLTAVAMYEQAPYQMVLSHGFIVDAKGHKMSKSLGNVAAPEKIWNSLGADIIRLWVTAADYRMEASISPEILQRTSEIYRRIRNTVRFLIANLFDFNPQQHMLPYNTLLALDQWAVRRAQQLQTEIIHCYETFQFHLVTQKLQHFCTIEMGSFYLDIIKDRQYTTGKESHARRSSQTAMYHLIESLVRVLAPITSFTAEEIWQHLPWQKTDSIFLTTWYQIADDIENSDTLKDTFWLTLIQVREQVNREIEKARHTGLVGSGLEAEVHLFCDPLLYQTLAPIKDELRFALITSEAHLHPQGAIGSETAQTTQMPELHIAIKASPHQKCQRCWHRRPEVSQSLDYPALCNRCIDTIQGKNEIRHFI